MDYCFQQDLNALAEPGFNSEIVNAFIAGFDMAIVSTFFPRFFGILNSIILMLPEHVRREKFAPVYGFQTMQRLAKERVEYLMANPEKTNSKVPTMFDAMLNPDVKKGQVTPPKTDMVADGCLMIAAGTDTTANVLGYLLWCVTQNQEVEQKLLAELRRGMKDRDCILDSATLEGEGFEYLRAVVKEALRLSYGVPGRIIRRVPKEGAVFNGMLVPGGVSIFVAYNWLWFMEKEKQEWRMLTIIVQTHITSGQYLQNTDEGTFPDPFRFDPERWLCDPEMYKLRDKQMTSFSRGSRSCIGIK